MGTHNSAWQNLLNGLPTPPPEPGEQTPSAYFDGFLIQSLGPTPGAETQFLDVHQAIGDQFTVENVDLMRVQAGESDLFNARVRPLVAGQYFCTVMFVAIVNSPVANLSSQAPLVNYAVTTSNVETPGVSSTAAFPSYVARNDNAVSRYSVPSVTLSLVAAMNGEDSYFQARVIQQLENNALTFLARMTMYKFAELPL